MREECLPWFQVADLLAQENPEGVIVSPLALDLAVSGSNSPQTLSHPRRRLLDLGEVTGRRQQGKAAELGAAGG